MSQGRRAYFPALSLVLSCLLASVAYAGRVVMLSSDTFVSVEKCPVQPKNSRQLSCKVYRQTTNYTCGPSAVMTLLNYYRKIAAQDLNKRTEMRIANEMGATAQGTTPDQVVDWLEGHGFKVDSGMHVTTDMLIENIDKGVPTIIAFDDHWILAKGYEKGTTPEEDSIIFTDSCCNTSVMYRETIDKMWLLAQMPSNHCSRNLGNYIAATPTH